MCHLAFDSPYVSVHPGPSTICVLDWIEPSIYGDPPEVKGINTKARNRQGWLRTNHTPFSLPPRRSAQSQTIIIPFSTTTTTRTTTTTCLSLDHPSFDPQMVVRRSHYCRMTITDDCPTRVPWRSDRCWCHRKSNPSDGHLRVVEAPNTEPST